MEEKEVAIKHQDPGVDEFSTNQADPCYPLPSCSTSNLMIAQLMEEKEDEINHVVAKIKDLEMTIKALTESFDALKAEIAEMQLQMKRARRDREKQNT